MGPYLLSCLWDVDRLLYYLWKKLYYKSSGNVSTHLSIALNLDLVPWWQEGVEPNDQLWVPLEQVGDTSDDTRSVDTETKTRREMLEH
jgi:hypothetical protein